MRLSVRMIAAATGFAAASIGFTDVRAQVSSSMLTGDVSLPAAAFRGAGTGHVAGHTILPNSSVALPQDIGRRAHTHYRVFVPAPGSQPAFKEAVSPAAGLPPYKGYYFETPASLACVYQLTTRTAGCDPNKVSVSSKGGSKVIALVDAYDLPTAASDLATFSQQFGLPPANFTKVYASGSQPAYDSGWALEEALDIEMAHAMAPHAKIYLVEAASNSYADLNTAVDKAYQLVMAGGGGEVSMSYGGPEFSGVTSLDSHFTKNGVLFFASTGDQPGVEYPSSSPHVIAVGGTSISREMINPKTYGAYLGETAWWNAGGGASQYFSQPAFQSAVGARFGIKTRYVPDIAANASEASLVWVSMAGSWYTVYGTSVASPLAAGIANARVPRSYVPQTELAYIYSNAARSSYFDVKIGECGPHAGFFTSAGTSASPILAYDLCTGVGTPQGAHPF